MTGLQRIKRPLDVVSSETVVDFCLIQIPQSFSQLSISAGKIGAIVAVYLPRFASTTCKTLIGANKWICFQGVRNFNVNDPRCYTREQKVIAFDLITPLLDVEETKVVDAYSGKRWTVKLLLQVMEPLSVHQDEHSACDISCSLPRYGARPKDPESPRPSAWLKLALERDQNDLESDDSFGPTTWLRGYVGKMMGCIDSNDIWAFSSRFPLNNSDKATFRDTNFSDRQRPSNNNA